MKPLSTRRTKWLRAIYELGAQLGRPPYPGELARRHGTTSTAQRNIIVRAIRDGHITVGNPGNRFAPRPIRVSPAARLELGLPCLVYLAFPLTEDSGESAAAWVSCNVGLPVVSALAIAITGWKLAEPACVLLAERCDGVIVWRDPMLVGRSDVVAAARLGIPVSVVDAYAARSVSSARQLWTAPLLQPIAD